MYRIKNIGKGEKKMAFINDYLTKEDTLALVSIPHYEFKWSDKYTTGRKCTIDKEKKIWFIQVPKVYGCELDRNEYVFLMYFNDICRKNEVIIRMQELGKQKDEKIIQKYSEPFIYGWRVLNINLLNSNKYSEEDISNVLEEALNAFGIDGSVKWNKPELKNQFKAIIIK